MKKLILLILILSLGVSLTACNNRKITKSNKTNSVVSNSKEDSDLKDEANPSKPDVSEPSESTSEEENSEPIKNNNSTSKPSTDTSGGSSSNKNETTNTNPNTNNVTQPTHESTTSAPSIEFLDSVGLTYEESQAIIEKNKTCKHCGQPTGAGHHRYGIDIKCYECGEMAKANTCHFCK